MNRSGVVAEFGGGRLGEIGRVRSEVGRVKPEERAVAQLQRWLEAGIQLEAGRGNERHQGFPAGAGDLEAKRLSRSRLRGAGSRAGEKSG